MTLRTTFLTLALCAHAATAGARGLPDWLESARLTPSPPASDSAHVHRILIESSVSVPASGRAIESERGVIRVLDRKGAEQAEVRVYYLASSAKIRQLRAWLVAPDGTTRTFDEHDAADVAPEGAGSLASETRIRALVPHTPLPGMVFAWEWTVESDVLLSQWTHAFGNTDPTAIEHFDLELPEGIEPEVRTIGELGVPPARAGQHWRWERRDIPARRVEPLSAGVHAALEQILVSARPVKPGARVPGPQLRTWQEVARWHAELAAASAQPAPEIQRTARDLVGDQRDMLDKARAIARRVQAINYVSVSLGLAHGGGYIPRAPATVLLAGAGDCKDKANLFCALSRAAGLEAWMVSVHSDGRGRIEKEWPSPFQFNHAIAALRVPAGTGLSAASDSTALGPLLFFDPTDPFTPFGFLPEAEQGSWGCLQDPEHGDLIELPVADPVRERSAWRLEATLDTAGALTGRWRAFLRGPRASFERWRHTQGADTYRRGFETALADWLGPAELLELASSDSMDVNAFRFDVSFRAPRVARRLGAGLMSLRCAPLEQRERWGFTDSTRRTPVVLPFSSFAESVVIHLPTGWEVEETPVRIGRQTDFGGFEADWSHQDGQCSFRYLTAIRPSVLAVERYSELRTWWAERNRVFQRQVVLRRKPGRD